MDVKIVSATKLADGQFIKFLDRDKRGKIEYIGRFVSKNESTDTVEIECPEGDFGFVISKNELYITLDTPTGWERFSKNPEKYRSSQKEKEVKKDLAPVVKTLKEQIKEFVEANVKEKEASLIKLAIKKFTGDSTTITNYVKLFKERAKTL